jgi:hypothetical protein
MVKIVLTYWSIREKAVAALEAVKPSIDSALEGNSLTFTKNQLSVIEKLTTALKEVVSPNLRKTICQFEKDINNKMVSKKFTTATLK